MVATWRRRRRGVTAGQALQRIAAGDAASRPQGPLAAWLQAMGWDGEDIGPRQAAGWLRRWQNEQAQAGASALRPWQRGPGAGRPARADQYHIGRQLFQRRHSISGVRDEAGHWQDAARGIEHTLWTSRADAWGTVPARPSSAEAILADYCRERRGVFGEVPRPRWRRLLQIVLGPSGSAPGIDGEPYEAYHHGASLVACLLAQAMYASSISDGAVEAALGPSVDLLVWILKCDGR